MHGSNRLGGTSLSDLLVFGPRAGLHAATYVTSLADARPSILPQQVDAAAAEALSPFHVPEADGAAGTLPENPYSVHQRLQQTMNDLVGIIRRAEEMGEALERLAKLRQEAVRAGVEGHRQFNPGWHLALDLRNMLLVSECVARAALERSESRGGHTRDDYPEMDRRWRRVNLVCDLAGTADAASGQISLTRRENPPIRPDLLALFEQGELLKYLTDEELAQ
jgi:succinate dehydrogenase / fumarate reductase flavoprotein subunit